MQHPETYIEINFKALENNIAVIKKHARGKNIQGVVKANAYGHGDLEIAKALEKIGIKSLGTARVNEGVRLREGGVTSELLILGGAEENEFETLTNYNLKPVVYSQAMAEKFNKYLSFRNIKHPVHVKFDTGMHRLGIHFTDDISFMKKLKSMSNLEIEGLMSHMSAAGAKESEWNNSQSERFKTILTDWKKEFSGLPKYIHLENSAGFFNFNFDFVNTARLGVAIYGYGHDELEPVLRLYSFIKDIKKVKKGETVSYGGWFKAQNDMTVGIVPVGYGDGFMRANKKGSVLIQGKQAPIISTICMDHFMVDMSGINGVNTGDRVTIIGEDHPAGYWAQTSGSIVYEVTTLLNPRIRRTYNGSN
ncbi:MAG: alanine racemase [Pseudomonadota bacterium]